jgi:hypothetical protein
LTDLFPRTRALEHRHPGRPTPARGAAGLFWGSDAEAAAATWQVEEAWARSLSSTPRDSSTLCVMRVRAASGPTETATVVSLPPHKPCCQATYLRDPVLVSKGRSRHRL